MRTLAPLTALALAVACADAPAERGAGPVVVASIHPVASILSSLAGDAAVVRTLLPPGAHPDTYEPTPRMARAVEDAALVVRVGGGLDTWLGGRRPNELVLADGIPLAGGRGPGTGNPHIWLDPVLVRDALLPRLVDAMTALLPDQVDVIRARAVAFADSLTLVDAEVRALLADVATRRFIAAHPAWDYFADRYGLEQVGVLHPSPGEEIGARELARLVDRARGQGVRAVMAEPQLGRDGVQAVADELDVRIGVVDPIGGPGADGREDYISLMRYNARAFARALGGGP